MRGSDIEIEEVRHTPKPDAVEDVAERATDNRAIGDSLNRVGSAYQHDC